MKSAGERRGLPSTRRMAGTPGVAITPNFESMETR